MKYFGVFCMMASMCIVQTTFPQLSLPKKAYMHLMGRVDNTMDITLNLIKIYDSIYADLTFGRDSCSHKSLSGTLSGDGSFTLSPFGSDSSFQFHGSFSGRNAITGSITLTDVPEPVPVVLVESYPSGSFPLLVYYNSDSLVLAKGKATPRATIRQCLILPGESSNPVLSDTLRKALIKHYASGEVAGYNADAVINQQKRTFFQNYTESNEELVKQFPDAGNLNWLLLKFMHILYNDHFLISCYTLNYGYTGGAHGMETQDYLLFDMQTGKKLTLSDLLVPGYTLPLTQLITNRLKKSLGLSVQEKLTDHGFFEEEIPPTTNFYILGNSIGFFYNHYEIAPYVNGPTDILIPFPDILHLISPTSPLQRLFPSQ